MIYRGSSKLNNTYGYDPHIIDADGLLYRQGDSLVGSGMATRNMAIVGVYRSSMAMGRTRAQDAEAHSTGSRILPWFERSRGLMTLERLYAPLSQH